MGLAYLPTLTVVSGVHVCILYITNYFKNLDALVLWKLMGEHVGPPSQVCASRIQADHHEGHGRRQVWHGTARPKIPRNSGVSWIAQMRHWTPVAGGVLDIVLHVTSASLGALLRLV